MVIVNKRKLEHFYMRVNSDQKSFMKECANKRKMSMAAYVWYLITKDNEENL